MISMGDLREAARAPAALAASTQPVQGHETNLAVLRPGACKRVYKARGLGIRGFSLQVELHRAAGFKAQRVGRFSVLRV